MPSEGRLSRAFYERPTGQVARDLLGKHLVHVTEEGLTSGMVVETEAYLGSDDPGSHASGRKTSRNAVMFGQAGMAYVYFTYGMHYCLNAVAKPPGEAGAVLIRSVEPLRGIRLMTKRRRLSDRKDLTRGPARLAQAFSVDKRHNGSDLTTGDLFITQGSIPPGPIIVTNRIGLSKGKNLPLRFYLAGNPYVSRP